MLEAGTYQAQTHSAAEDALFHRQLTRLLAVHGALAWLAAAIAAGGYAGLRVYGAGVIGAAVIASLAAALAGGAGAAITWILAHDVLDHHFRAIRSRAKLGAERLDVDDPERAAGGVENVIFEWYHIREALRSKDILALVFTVAAALGAVMVIAAGVAVALTAAAVIAAPGGEVAIAGSLIAAAGLVFGAVSVAFGRSLRGAKCLVADELDPAAAIQRRLRALIAEVKDLRRHGVVGAPTGPAGA